MANMCMNLLRVDGPGADLTRFAETVAGPESALDFDRAMPMPEQFAIPADGSRPYPRGMSQGEVRKRLTAFGTTALIEPKDRLEPLNWAEWRTINWGPIAPAANAHGDFWPAGIRFETRWCPPQRLVDNLALRFPTLRFALSYFEPLDGFAGRACWENGRRTKNDVTSERKDPFFAQVYEEDFGGDAATLDSDARKTITFTVGVEDSQIGVMKIDLEEALDGSMTPHVSMEDPALAALRANAQRGDADAQLRLALCCLEGEGVHPADIPQGLNWLRKAVTQGSAEAKATLAVWSLLNEGAALDREQAVTALREAADEGDYLAGVSATILDASGVLCPTGSGAAPEVHGTEPCPTPPISLVYKRPEPEKAARLAVRAFLLATRLGASSGQMKLIEEAIRLDQINALTYYHAFRANLCHALGNENPEKATACYTAALMHKKGSRLGEAEVAYKEAASLDPFFLWPLNNLAWMWATAVDPSVRRGKAAVRYAREACVRSDWNCWAFIGTLAAAHAEAGDFEQAVDCQLACLALCPQSHRAESKEALECFRAGKALVDRGTTPANEKPK